MRTYRSAMRETMRPEAVRMWRSGKVSQSQIARDLGVSRGTVQRWVKPYHARRVHQSNVRSRAAAHQRNLAWDTAKWADALALKAWLREMIAQERLFACDVSEVVSGWGGSGQKKVSFWTVDRVFVSLGLHVAQLPDEVWVG